MAHPHIETRGRVYWYRRLIPADLISAYDGSREIRQSLNTKNPKVAERLARLKSVELDHQFDRKRSQLAAGLAPGFEFVDTELTDEQIRRLCLLWQRSVLETDDQNRTPAAK